MTDPALLLSLRSRLLREANSPQLAQRLETVLKEARRQAVEVVNVLQPELKEDLTTVNKLRTHGRNGTNRFPGLPLVLGPRFRFAATVGGKKDACS